MLDRRSAPTSKTHGDARVLSAGCRGRTDNSALMKTASQILASVGIVLRRIQYGNSKTLCPKCSRRRKKKRERCLSVDVNERGVRWLCHNGDCGWNGGEFYEGAGPERS